MPVFYGNLVFKFKIIAEKPSLFISSYDVYELIKREGFSAIFSNQPSLEKWGVAWIFVNSLHIWLKHNYYL